MNAVGGMKLGELHALHIPVCGRGVKHLGSCISEAPGKVSTVLPQQLLHGVRGRPDPRQVDEEVVVRGRLAVAAANGVRLFRDEAFD